jgi:DHA2 family multidrug resistance protein
VAWISVVAFGLFLERSFDSSGPIVKLTPFRKPTFAFACAFNLVIGFGLYSATYMIPVFQGRVRGYDSLQIGETVFVTGVAQIASTVIAARTSQTVDRRIIIAVGLTLFAASLWLTSQVNIQWGFAGFLIPQALRGFAIMLCIVPAVGMALTGFAMTELRYASGLFNLMRNLGGAVGIAVVNTWLADNTRIQALRMGESLGEGAHIAPRFVGDLAGRIGASAGDPAQALLMAQGEFGRLVGRYALTSAFEEVFRMMAWLFIAALVMAPFCKTPVEAAAPIEAH